MCLDSVINKVPDALAHVTKCQETELSLVQLPDCILELLTHDFAFK